LGEQLLEVTLGNLGSHEGAARAFEPISSAIPSATLGRLDQERLSIDRELQSEPELAARLALGISRGSSLSG
jgi:hypothetical protein